MKFVILASLVAATYAAAGDCTASLTTLPTGYVFRTKTAWGCTQTADKGTEAAAVMYTATDIAAKTKDSDFTTFVGCASGYTAAAKRTLDCAAPATPAMKGCTKTAAVKPKLGCDTASVAKSADNYDAFDTGAGTYGQKIKKACVKKSGANQAGGYTWTCGTGATDTKKGTWAKTGACVAAAWNSATASTGGCPLPVCGTAETKIDQKCNTGTATDCTAPAPKITCPKAKTAGTACKAPTCDATKTVANSPYFVGVCTKADTKVAVGTAFKGAAWTSTCKEIWKGQDDTQAAWVKTMNGSGGGGSGGSSASTLSVFAAFAIIVAYL